MFTEQPARSDPTRTSVLVVDDDPDMLEISKLLLEPNGCDVDTALDGLLGLQAARTKRYDVIVLDIDMPRMGGIEVGRALRSDPATASVSIIIQTSLSEAWVRGRFAGYDAFVSKPPADIDLVDAVLKVLHHTMG